MGQGIYFKVKQASVSSSGYQKILSFQMPTPSPIRIIDISLNPDAVFSATGLFGVAVGGQTNETSGQPLPSALTIPVHSFKNKNKLADGREAEGLILYPGDKIEIFGSNSSGTGKLTAVVVGEIL